MGEFRLEENGNLRKRWIREFILGSQDGLVNVLGLLLGFAAATQDATSVLVAGVAALFAESISMGAVAYTSTRAGRDFYKSMVEQEEREIDEIPHKEIAEIRHIYLKKGFRGRLLSQIVEKITSNRQVWLDTMMTEELRLFPEDASHPIKAAGVVFVATLFGSAVPLLPFFFMSVQSAMIVSAALSTATLFGIGAAKAKLTTGSWKRSGAELAAIGILAAVAGYAIGKLLEVIFL